MKKVNLTIVGSIIATFVISMFAFQPTTTEAGKNVSPMVSATPRKIRKMPKPSIEVENDETHLTRKPTTKVKTKKPGYKEGGVNDTTTRKSRRKRN